MAVDDFIGRLSEQQEIVEGYRRVLRLDRRAQKSGDDDDLRSALVALCALLTSLIADAGFWDDLGKATETAGDELANALSNLDVLLDSEAELLQVELGWYDEEVDRLIRDLRRGVQLLGEAPGPTALENFRERLEALRRGVCAVAETDEGSGFRQKAKRALKIGILVVGGPVLAIIDVVTIPHHWNPNFAKASISLGAALFKKGVFTLTVDDEAR
jgi:hypothetical protein